MLRKHRIWTRPALVHEGQFHKGSAIVSGSQRMKKSLAEEEWATQTNGTTKNHITMRNSVFEWNWMTNLQRHVGVRNFKHTHTAQTQRHICTVIQIQCKITNAYCLNACSHIFRSVSYFWSEEFPNSPVILTLHLSFYPDSMWGYI